MSDPLEILKRYIVLKFMEKHQMQNNTEVQGELIDNALKTAEAIERMSMFNFKNPTNKYPNPQQPNINYKQPEAPVFTPPPVTQAAQATQPTIPQPPAQAQEAHAQAQEEHAQAYNNMTNQHNQMSQYHQAIMEINRMLMAMQQDFFQNIQKIHQQLNEIVKGF